MSEFLDIIVAILLVCTIAYAVVLNKRLAALRQDREALEKLSADFFSATARAENSIKRLKNSSSEASALVKENLSQARELRDDLAYLVERGEAAADKLVASVRTARETPPSGGKKLPEFEGVDEDGPDVLSRDAERELLQALRAAR